jgi:hypothetical protein
MGQRHMILLLVLYSSGVRSASSKIYRGEWRLSMVGFLG